MPRRLEVLPGLLERPCQVDPASLPREAGRLHCADCGHDVVDVAGLTLQEFAALRERASRERICSSYSLDAQRRVLLRATPSSPSLIAVAMSALLAACGPAATTTSTAPPAPVTAPMPAAAPATTLPHEQASTPAPKEALTTAAPQATPAEPAPASVVESAPAPASSDMTTVCDGPPQQAQSKSKPTQSHAAPTCKPGRAPQAHPRVNVELAGY